MHGYELLEHVIIDPQSGCWLWQGATDRDGYGIARVDGQMRRVHRAVYEQQIGPIPTRHVLDHLLADRALAPGPCRSRACCNPAHVEPVTVAVNGARVRNWHAAKTHCPQGHPYADHGRVYRCRDGHERRFCMACRQERNRARAR